MEVAYVRDAQLADVLVLAKTMRKADRQEIMVNDGMITSSLFLNS